MSPDAMFWKPFASALGTGIVLITSMSMSGCGLDDEPPLPVADTTMVSVLLDLHLLRARSSYRDRVSLDSFDRQRKAILARHGMNDAQLDAAVKAYIQQPDAYEEVYGTVIDSLNAIRVTLSRAQRDSVLIDSLIRTRALTRRHDPPPERPPE